MNSTHQIHATVASIIYKGDNDFKIFTIENLNSDGPFLTLKGYIPVLTPNTPYIFNVEGPLDDKNGYGSYYNVKSCYIPEPTTKDATLLFLSNIVSLNIAQNILEVYPDIIDRLVHNKEIDTSNIKGLGKKRLLRLQSKTQESIGLSPLISKFGKYMSMNEIEKLFDAFDSNVKQIMLEMEKDSYGTLTGISGIGFKKADAIVLKMSPEDIDSYQRCKSCLEYILSEHENKGNTKIKSQEAYDLIKENAIECISFFQDVIQNDDFVVNHSENTIQRKYTAQCEECVADFINQATHQIYRPFVDKEDYRQINKVALTNEQLSIFDRREGLFILNGPAGSGKSQTLASYISALKDSGKTIAVCAPTGKAAKVISEYSGEQATTIHRLLGADGNMRFQYDELHHLPFDVILVDEFSMCDLWLFYALTKAISIIDTRLILIGDDAQLPSVGCGNLLHDMLNIVPTITLTQIFRYNDGGIMKVATDIRQSNHYLNHITSRGIQVFGDKEFTFYDPNEDQSKPKSAPLDCAITCYMNFIKHGINPDDIMFLTPKRVGNTGCDYINKILQSKLTPPKPSFHTVKNHYAKNDLVMATRNNYHAITAESYFNDNIHNKETFIANGQTGVVTDLIYDDDEICGIEIAFKDEKPVVYFKRDCSGLDLGYASTIHKSQGGSCNYVILLTPKQDSYFLNSNLLYTAVTRTKKSCYHFGDLRSVNKAIYKKENFVRETNLKALLKR